MGGIVASMLARICAENRQNKDKFKYKSIDFDFVIIAAASKSPECYHEIFYDSNSKIGMPSLHIIGKTDKLVPEDKALELAEYFIDPVIFVQCPLASLYSTKNVFIYGAIFLCYIFTALNLTT